MKRVIVWGIGEYGRYLYKVLRAYYTHRYEVVGLGDRRAEELNKQFDSGRAIFDEEIFLDIKHIYSYDEARQLFDDGRIDGLIIGIQDENTYKQLEDIFNVQGIEIYNLKCNDRAFAEEFAEKTYDSVSGKLTVDVVKDVRVFAYPIWSGKHRYAYLVTESGMVLQESDRYLNLSNSPSDELFLPDRFDYNESIDIEKAVSLLQIGADVNYGHFVFSVMTKVYEMERSGFDGNYLIYDSAFAREWISLVAEMFEGLEKRVIWIGRLDGTSPYRVKELHCINNVVDSSKKNAKMLVVLADAVLEHIRERGVIIDQDERPRRIYLKRNGTRKLIGCSEVIGKYGLKTVTLEDMTLEEQILTLRNANIVLAEHGASLTNCMFMKSGTCLVDTFGTGFVDMFFVELLNERKIRFRMLVSQAEYAKYDFDDDYVIDPTLMDMALKDATGEWN